MTSPSAIIIMQSRLLGIRNTRSNASLTLQEGLREFAQNRLSAFADWVRSWHVRRNPEMSIIVRYEDKLADTLGIVTQVAEHFELDSRHETIQSIVTANSFERLSGGRKRGDTDNKSFFRSGISGNWKRYLTSELNELYKDIIGDFLIEFGYEKDKSW